MVKRSLFKTASCIVSGSALCLSSCAPVAFGMESSKVIDFHVGISNEKKEKLTKALDLIHKWVEKCCKDNNESKEVLTDANILHNNLKNLLNLTYKRCRKYENSKNKDEVNIAFPLAIQKAFSDILNPLCEDSEIATVNDIDSINERLSIRVNKMRWKLEVPDKLKELNVLCKICKDILEKRETNYSSDSVITEKIKNLEGLRDLILDYEKTNKNLQDNKKFCIKLKKIGYDYKDPLLKDKIIEDITSLEFLKQKERVRKFANESSWVVGLFEEHFNPTVKDNLKVSGVIQYLYPFFTAVAIKDRVNQLLGLRKLAGMLEFLCKLNEYLFKKPIDEKSSEEKQKEQLKKHEELKGAMLEHKKNIIKYSVSKFLNNDAEKDKLNEYLEPSGYEFLLPVYS